MHWAIEAGYVHAELLSPSAAARPDARRNCQTIRIAPVRTAGRGRATGPGDAGAAVKFVGIAVKECERPGAAGTAKDARITVNYSRICEWRQR